MNIYTDTRKVGEIRENSYKNNSKNINRNIMQTVRQTESLIAWHSGHTRRMRNTLAMWPKAKAKVAAEH